MPISCKEWRGDDPSEPPSAGEARPSKCPACGKPAVPVGEGVNLHAHSKHRTRDITRLREVPERIESLDEASTPVVVEQTIRVRRYLCTVCETTCTVVPTEVRPCADLACGFVVFALAIWVLHPAVPSAQDVREWLFPGRSTLARGWPQLHRWARDSEQFLGEAEKVSEQLQPKKRAEQLVQICAARAPPELRGAPPWRRAHRGATKSQ